MIQNYLLQSLARPLEHRTVMRYEDFAANPAPILEKALQEIGIGATLELQEPDEIVLEPTHSIAGNTRVRFGEPRRRIALEEEWRRELPRGMTRILSLLGLAGLRRFGYRIRLEKNNFPPP